MPDRWRGRLALTWANPALFQGLWICPSHPPSLPFHLCVSMCVCVSVCRLQTDQLFVWALYQSAGRSVSHMWRTKQEAVRLGSNDLNVLAKNKSVYVFVGFLCYFFVTNFSTQLRAVLRI